MQPPAELIISGRIATLRGAAGFGWVEALAIHHGCVVATGSLDDLETLAGSITKRWQLGRHLLVTPSITDAHLHLIDAALAAGQLDLSSLDVAGVAGAIAGRHRQRLAAGDARGWLLGHGWSLADLGGRPGRELLDEAAPGRPVALWSHDHHARWLSSEALRVAAIIGRDDPPAGRLERDTGGQPTGILYEQAAGLVDAAIPEATASQVESAVSAYARVLAGLGVASVHDPGGVAPDPLLHGGPTRYRAMASAGGLPLRVTASVREEQLELAIEMGFRSGRPEGERPSGRYRDGWLKAFSDGALGSRTAALLAPYESDDPAGPPPGGALGMRLRTPERLAELARRAAQAGIASQIHAIGDAAVRATLDVLETVPPVPGAMHRIEHAQLVHPADLPRFAGAGIAASVQPCHLLSDAEAARAAWGARSATAFPLGDLDRQGTLLPFGTDAPVEPPDPWPGIAAAVTRRGAGWPAHAAFGPRQAVSLARALRGACLDGPRSARAADEGHLDVGARADLLILPAEPFDGPASAEQLASVRPLATMLDGSVVFESPDFDP
ncbi:MAG TPA: amidohydrolase [Candidatus Limnocylindrales bacterium]|nr:amidohydrolase [Candidatus Limnocylindrales bacterium]